MPQTVFRLLTIFQLTPQLLKAALTKALNEILDPIRADYAASEDWQKITELAYPTEEKQQKVKKQKDKGDPAKRAAALAAKAEQLKLKEGGAEEAK